MTAIVDGYWSEVTMLVAGPPAHFPFGAHELSLAGYRATSPRTAVRWLRNWAARIADGLDPSPETGPIPAECLREAPDRPSHPGDILRNWATDAWAQGRGMDALAMGERVNVSVGGPDRIMGLCDVEVFYSLSSRPIAIEFMAEWNLAVPTRSAPPPHPAIPLRSAVSSGLSRA